MYNSKNLPHSEDLYTYTATPFGALSKSGSTPNRAARSEPPAPPPSAIGAVLPVFPVGAPHQLYPTSGFCSRTLIAGKHAASNAHPISAFDSNASVIPLVFCVPKPCVEASRYVKRKTAQQITTAPMAKTKKSAEISRRLRVRERRMKMGIIMTARGVVSVGGPGDEGRA